MNDPTPQTDCDRCNHSFEAHDYGDACTQCGCRSFEEGPPSPSYGNDYGDYESVKTWVDRYLMDHVLPDPKTGAPVDIVDLIDDPSDSSEVALPMPDDNRTV